MEELNNTENENAVSRANIIRCAAGAEENDPFALNFLIGIAKLGTEYSDPEKRKKLLASFSVDEAESGKFNEETENALDFLRSNGLSIELLAAEELKKIDDIRNCEALNEIILIDDQDRFTVDEIARRAADRIGDAELQKFSAEQEKKDHKDKNPSFEELLELSLSKPVNTDDSDGQAAGLQPSPLRRRTVQIRERRKGERWLICLPLVRDFLNHHDFGAVRTENILGRLKKLAVKAS